jgi:hypothetical protein
MTSGNIMAGWLSAGTPMVVALLASRPDDGIPWVNRALHGLARLGTAGGGLYIENRANFAAQAGNYREAGRIYSTARTETRRAGMVWPRRPLTQQLLDLTRSRLDPTDFRRAWQEGERLSLSHLVQPDSAVDPPGGVTACIVVVIRRSSTPRSQLAHKLTGDPPGRW